MRLSLECNKTGRAKSAGLAMVLWLGVAASSLQAAPVAVPNFSFENPAIFEAQATGWISNGGAQTGGVNPYNTGGAFTSAAEGVWFHYLNLPGFAGPNPSVTESDSGLIGSAQVGTYTLTVSGGHRINDATTDGAYVIELLAGGTVIGSRTLVDPFAAIATDSWLDITAVAIVRSGDAAVGRDLTIRLSATDGTGGLRNQGQFDNVRLEHSPSIVCGSQTLFAADAADIGSNLYLVDPETGGSTVVGDPVAAITGLAFHPNTGVLYGSTAVISVGSQTIPEGALVTVDTVTGAATLVGSFGFSEGRTLADLAFERNTGVLYGWLSNRRDELYRVNLTTGQATLVGVAGLSLSGGQGLTFDDAGTLYLAGEGTGGMLRTIDPETGLPTGGVQLSGFEGSEKINSLAWSGCEIFGVTSSSHTLLRINPANGVITAIGDGLAGDGVDAIAFTLAPIITAVLPDRANNTGPVTVTVAGSGLPSGASLSLARAAPADTIDAGSVSVRADGRGMSGTFDLAGVQTGSWDVVVITPDQRFLVLPNAFTVEAAAPHQLRVDIVGPPVIRANRRKAYDIVIENLGNGDVLGMPLWISGLPVGATVETDFDLSPPPDEGSEPDWDSAPRTFTGPSGHYLALVLPRIAPGINVRRIFLTVPMSVSSFTLSAALTPPWVDSSALDQCLGGAGLITATGCMGFRLDAIQAFLMATPGIEALNGVALWAKIAWQCEGATHLPAALAISEQVLDFMLQAIEASAPSGCTNALGPRWQQRLAVTVVTSIDPNEKIGTTGVGPGRSIGIDQRLPYSIRFENLENATAPAQEVVVVDQLDANTMDLATLSLTTITFGDRTLFPPPGLTRFTTDVDLRPQENLIVRVGVGLDVATRVLSWSMTSLDPATGEPPANPLSGFLPPNLTPPEGEGSVLFTVLPKSNLGGGASIQNVATILFDGVPVVTPAWSNVIDASPPESSVLPLPGTQDSASFTVRWDASGSPADLLDYSVYVSENGNAYRPWRLHTTATADTFTAPGGVTYAFYSLARDSSGNLERAPSVPDAQTFSGVSVPDPRTMVLALDGAIPNPVSGEARVRFTLASRERAVLEVMDVAGRRVLKQEVGQLGPGRHSVDVGAALGRPGLYFLRLTQGVEARSARMVVLRP